jgi:hypothetical protein
MAINPNISLAVRGIELQDPLAQYGKVMAIQGAQQQNQLAQLQMREAQATAEERNALRQLDPTSADYVNQLFKLNPQLGIQYRKEQTAADTAKLTQQEAGIKVQAAKRDFVAQARRDTSRNPSDANITAYKEDLIANPMFTAEEKRQMVAGADRILAMPIAERGAFMASQGASAGELKPTVSVAPTGIVQTPAFGGAASIVPGTSAAFQMTPAQIASNEIAKGQLDVSRGQLGVSQGQLDVAQRGKDLENRRVIVAEENARRDADPAFQQRMAGAKATGEAIAKGDVAAVQSLPKIIARAEDGARLIDEMIGKRDPKTGGLVKGAAPHPGFQGAVGATILPGARFVPGTDEAGFMSRFDQIKGASFLEAFESLKGGGAITEKEGAKGTDAINRMSIATDEKEFVRAATDLQDIIRRGVASAQKRAAKAAPAGGGALSDDPLGLRQ